MNCMYCKNKQNNELAAESIMSEQTVPIDSTGLLHCQKLIA